MNIPSANTKPQCIRVKKVTFRNYWLASLISLMFLILVCVLFAHKVIEAMQIVNVN